MFDAKPSFYGVPGMGIVYRMQVPNCEGGGNS